MTRSPPWPKSWQQSAGQVERLEARFCSCDLYATDTCACHNDAPLVVLSGDIVLREPLEHELVERDA